MPAPEKIVHTIEDGRGQEKLLLMHISEGQEVKTTLMTQSFDIKTYFVINFMFINANEHKPKWNTSKQFVAKEHKTKCRAVPYVPS